MTIFSNLSDLAVLNAGQNPAWTDQPTVTAPNGPPTSPTDGVALDGAIVALVGVVFGPSEPGVVNVEIPSWVSGDEYSIFIGAGSGTEFAHDAWSDADVVDTLNALAILINADPIAATATVVGEILRIETDEPVVTDPELVILPQGATAVDLVIWLYSGGAWGAPTNGAISITRNLLERAEVAGAERAYIEIVATDGECTPRIGPCGLEG